MGRSSPLLAFATVSLALVLMLVIADADIELSIVNSANYKVLATFGKNNNDQRTLSPGQKQEFLISDGGRGGDVYLSRACGDGKTWEVFAFVDASKGADGPILKVNAQSTLNSAPDRNNKAAWTYWHAFKGGYEQDDVNLGNDIKSRGLNPGDNRGGINTPLRYTINKLPPQTNCK